MKVIIDTSSLLSLVRYYLPFDKSNTLNNFIKAEIECGNLIVIDLVYEECVYTSKGKVIKCLDYLTDKDFKRTFKIPIKTDELFPPSRKKFYNLLDNNFRTPLSRKLNDAEYEERKTKFLDSADARMIILALLKKKQEEDVVIVTEETGTNNDNKVFRKIPFICEILKIEVMTLPELLEKYQGIDIEFKQD